MHNGGAIYKLREALEEVLLHSVRHYKSAPPNQSEGDMSQRVAYRDAVLDLCLPDSTHGHLRKAALRADLNGNLLAARIDWYCMSSDGSMAELEAPSWDISNNKGADMGYIKQHRESRKGLAITSVCHRRGFNVLFVCCDWYRFWPLDGTKCSIQRFWTLDGTKCSIQHFWLLDGTKCSIQQLLLDAGWHRMFHPAATSGSLAKFLIRVPKRRFRSTSPAKLPHASS
jgi:hypothetical protein